MKVIEKQITPRVLYHQTAQKLREMCIDGIFNPFIQKCTENYSNIVCFKV